MSYDAWRTEGDLHKCDCGRVERMHYAGPCSACELAHENATGNILGHELHLSQGLDVGPRLALETWQEGPMMVAACVRWRPEQGKGQWRWHSITHVRDSLGAACDSLHSHLDGLSEDENPSLFAALQLAIASAEAGS